MNGKLFFTTALGFLINGALCGMEADKAQAEQSAVSQGPEQSSVLFDKSIIIHPWHYGREVTRLQTVVASALVIVNGNAASHAVYQAAMKSQQEKIQKLAADMEPRKKCVAEAQKLTSSFAPTLVSVRKAHLTDGLLTTVTTLNDIVALQEAHIQALMKRNEELEVVLQSH